MIIIKNPIMMSFKLDSTVPSVLYRKSLVAFGLVTVAYMASVISECIKLIKLYEKAKLDKAEMYEKAKLDKAERPYFSESMQQIFTFDPWRYLNFISYFSCFLLLIELQTRLYSTRTENHRKLFKVTVLFGTFICWMVILNNLFLGCFGPTVSLPVPDAAHFLSILFSGAFAAYITGMLTVVDSATITLLKADDEIKTETV